MDSVGLAAVLRHSLNAGAHHLLFSCLTEAGRKTREQARFVETHLKLVRVVSLQSAQ